MSIPRSFIRNVLAAAAALIALILFPGCSSSDAVKQLTAEQRFTIGMEKFRNRDYLDAIEEFKMVSLQFQGSAVADSAQFFMAECRFQREEYILAAFEYDVLIRTMPASTFIPRARFQRATSFYSMSPRSYLDQENSRKAIDEYQTFLEYHPNDSLARTAEARIMELNTKLAQKDYDNGVTYFKLEYYKAATYYFDLVLEKYHDTPFAEPALLRKAAALSQRKRYADAKITLEKFLAKYPNSVLKDDAESIRADIETGLTAKEPPRPPTKAPLPGKGS